MKLRQDMSLEIERRFLVTDCRWYGHCVSCTPIRQGYLPSVNGATVRVRVAGDHAWLTVKSRLSALVREEMETELPLRMAEDLLRERCIGSIVEKLRYEVPHAGMIWEVDIFGGTNSGLALAEIELDHAEQAIDLPDWVGREITEDRHYGNSRLAQRPFCLWSPAERVAHDHRDEIAAVA